MPQPQRSYLFSCCECDATAAFHQCFYAEIPLTVRAAIALVKQAGWIRCVGGEDYICPKCSDKAFQHESEKN